MVTALVLRADYDALALRLLARVSKNADQTRRSRSSKIREEVGQKPLEVWFQDEPHVGQETKLTRHWAKRGTRASATNDQHTTSV